ncbi:MAG: hypothetical protein ACXADY_09645, partial [Candidatus Hodarchaeales archaeon]
MTYQRKTLKRFMDTILSRIPDLIKENYSTEDQFLLNEFLAILQSYYKADSDRQVLIFLFEKFIRKFNRSNLHARLP